MKTRVPGPARLAAGTAVSRSLANDRPSVLVISPHESDHGMLGRAFDNMGWEVHRAYDLEGSKDCLREYLISVVLCDCSFQEHSWKDLLQQLSNRSNAPALVVACDAADGRLWADVLNLGGYDVLVKPFCLAEVIWVVAGAHRQPRRRTTAETTQDHLA